MKKIFDDNIIGKEILIVDDTPDNLRLLVEIFKQQNYKVRPVPNAKLALTVIKASPPDLILLDINMPEIDGYELCRILKQDDTTKEIPVIFLSAMNETIDKVKAFNIGGVDYITKPFHLEEVLARVGAHLKLSSLLKQLGQVNNILEQEVKERTEEILKLHTAKHMMESELKVARTIQTAMLQKSFFVSNYKNKIEVYADASPAKHVGGDFYDYFYIDKNKLFFCIGDVSGKGIPAAIFMAMVKTIIKVEAKGQIPLDELMFRVNQILLEENESCMFASVLCGIIDTDNAVLTFCNAGHMTPLMARKNQKFNFIKLPRNSVLGILPVTKDDYAFEELKLIKGDRIFLYSDGVTDAINNKNEMFTKEKLQFFLNNSGLTESKNLIVAVKTAIMNHIGKATQTDDIAMLLIEYFN